MKLRDKTKDFNELLAGACEVDDDRDYFARVLGRRYRLRRPTAGERDLTRALYGPSTGKPNLTSTRPARTAYVIVEQLRPGERIRLYCEGTTDPDMEWHDDAIELLLSAMPKSRRRS
jgi:hypothetical protein